MNVTKLDFVAIPTTDPERSKDFSVGSLRLRPDQRKDTCILGLHLDRAASAHGGGVLMLHNRYAPSV